MAIFRKLQCDFWDDEKMLEYSPEDKYFYLCLLTNPKTTQCGIYKITAKQLEYYTGYNRESIKVLIERFQDKYKLIIYDEDTREMAIKNWPKYNYSESPSIKACIEKELKYVENIQLINFLYADTVYTQYPKRREEKRREKNKTEKNIQYKEIIEHLNNIANTNYKHDTTNTRDKIKSRFNDGYIFEDFVKVNIIKTEQWKDDIKMSPYLRPITLYGNKFEGYLNEYYRKYGKRKPEEQHYVLCPACSSKVIGTISYCSKCGLEKLDFKNTKKIKEAKEYINK